VLDPEKADLFYVPIYPVLSMKLEDDRLGPWIRKSDADINKRRYSKCRWWRISTKTRDLMRACYLSQHSSAESVQPIAPCGGRQRPGRRSRGEGHPAEKQRRTKYLNSERFTIDTSGHAVACRCWSGHCMVVHIVEKGGWCSKIVPLVVQASSVASVLKIRRSFFYRIS